MRAAFVLLVYLACVQVWAKEGMDCWGTNKKSTTKRVGGFVVRFSPYHDRKEDDDLCRAVLLDSSKNAVFSATDSAFSLVLAGKDVNGDGTPDVVFEGYSGGAHCCWTYYIVSLGESPGVLASFENERGAGFVRDKTTGRMEIVTMDGAFDYFDFLSHAETPFPSVYLRLDGRELSDVSLEHVKDYDREIAEARKHLSPEMIEKFRSVADHEALVSDIPSRQTASLVLQIVFALLYSGRWAQAHKTIKDMWPAFDQKRIWSLIVETKRNGLLDSIRRQNEQQSTPRHTSTAPPEPNHDGM